MRQIVLNAEINNDPQDVIQDLSCFMETGEELELFLNIDDASGMLDVIEKLFDASSVERIKTALKNKRMN